MNYFSLNDRLKNFGTKSVAPKDIPDVHFALPSTLNWMKALVILAKYHKLDFQSARTFYASVQVRNCSEAELNSLFEQLVFSLNQISCLNAMSAASNKVDVAPMAIVTWYYAIYGAASAMIVAADGSFQESHAKTAGQWDKIFSANGRVMQPFGDRLSSLLKETIKMEIESIQSRGKHSLIHVPKTVEQAWGCIAQYISGTSNWEKNKLEQRVRQDPEFKKHKFENFRTKEAKSFRDIALRKRSLSFLHQAIRYRGKANYRDAIFLTYGDGIQTLVTNYIEDLKEVAIAFSAMAAGYVSVRIGNEIWTEFVEDLDQKLSTSMTPKDVWF